MSCIGSGSTMSSDRLWASSQKKCLQGGGGGGGGGSNKVRFKPSCSATETSYKIEILLVAHLCMILSYTRITKR